MLKGGGWKGDAKGRGMEGGWTGSGGQWRACCCSWAVVLSPCPLLSCIGIAHHCCVLSLPGCPSLLSCLCVSMCGCCTLLLVRSLLSPWYSTRNPA